MKRIFIIFLISVVSISCNEKKKEKEQERYTQHSEEINSLKAAINDYEKGDWKAWASHYADTATFNYNSRENAMSKDEIAKAHQEEIAQLSTYSFPDEFDEYEMVVTDDGETWVNYWGVWQGTVASNNKTVEIPVHITSRFVNGKIVKEYAYFDNSEMMKVLSETDSTDTSMDSKNKS